MKLEKEEEILLKYIRELRISPMSIVELMIRTFNDANQITEGKYNSVVYELDKCVTEMTALRLGK